MSIYIRKDNYCKNKHRLPQTEQYLCIQEAFYEQLQKVSIMEM